MRFEVVTFTTTYRSYRAVLVAANINAWGDHRILFYDDILAGGCWRSMVVADYTVVGPKRIHLHKSVRKAA